MEMIMLIAAISVIMWYIIDKFKPLWNDAKYGNYVTIGVAGIFGFVTSFGFTLDLVYALGLVASITPLGITLTALSLMCGSSAVAEIISRIKGNQKDQVAKNVDIEIE